MTCDPMSEDEEIDENRARMSHAATMRQHAASEAAADEVYNAGYAWQGLTQKKQLPPVVHHQFNQEYNNWVQRREANNNWVQQREANEIIRQRQQQLYRAKQTHINFDERRGAVEMDYVEMGMNGGVEEDEIMHPVLVGRRRSRDHWER